MAERKTQYKCPHCGWVYDPDSKGAEAWDLVPTHDYPKPGRAVCPGANQIPRNALSDRRPLWKDEVEAKEATDHSPGFMTLPAAITEKMMNMDIIKSRKIPVFLNEGDKRPDRRKVQPIELLKVGDEIIGPFGRYHFTVEEISESHVFGVYTKCPAGGYSVGSKCIYPINDWLTSGGFQYANPEGKSENVVG